MRERFLREARSAGRLNHPNIVTIFDVGEDAGVAYIAMELLEGRSLQQMMRSQPRMPHAAAADIAAQVADALDHAQQYRIVHRDIKPANVMVAASGRCKLTDFGIAYVPTSSMTQTGAALGSPKYMSPEQVAGITVDGRADVYSLAAVIFEATTGRPPFSSKSWIETLSRRLYEPPPNVREIDPDLSPAFAAVLQQAMDRDPARRPATAGELLDRLESAITSRNGSVGENGSAPTRARRVLRKLLRF